MNKSKLPGPGQLHAAKPSVPEDQQAPMPAERAAIAIDGGLFGPPPGADLASWSATLMKALATPSAAFLATELTRLSSALRTGGEGAASQADMNAALAMIDGVGPRDEVEAMLATHMAVTHALVMEFAGRVHRAINGPQLDSAGNMVTKFMRTFTTQLEMLAKLRRGGEQTVRVEHVHVHHGGQAVVGNVHTGTGGRAKNE